MGTSAVEYKGDNMVRFWIAVAASLCLASQVASAITIEFLQGEITPATVGWLSGLSCRNYDHVVHLDIGITWPDATVETSGYERLIFSASSAEYLFPKGTYMYLHGSYIVKGYFIARAGGMHQGIISDAFEKIDDAQVMLAPNVVEKKAKSSACR
jgi:hypothetical protein